MAGPVPIAWVGGRPARRGRAAEAGARQLATRAEVSAAAFAIGSNEAPAQGFAHEQVLRKANLAGQLPRHQQHRQRRGAAGRRGQSRRVSQRRCPPGEQPGGAYFVVSRSDRFFRIQGASGWQALRTPSQSAIGGTTSGHQGRPGARSPARRGQGGAIPPRRRSPWWAPGRPRAGSSWGAAVLGPLCRCSCRPHAAAGARRSMPGPASQSTRSVAAASSRNGAVP